MPDRVVLDTSVIASIFFKEASSSAAEAVARDSDLITLDFALVEVANVAWKRHRFFGEDAELVREALHSCRKFVEEVCEVIPATELLEEALKIAVEEEITVYDALFVAASESTASRLVTTDAKLFEAAKRRVEAELI
ncbi:MAG: type II toxin-antitoxin system VapC family toxin [Euryarchaeota archaeon]|nr:type II toxin-antitoxin system VapC family toxin [Euryarchaeota archaeon]